MQRAATPDAKHPRRDPHWRCCRRRRPQGRCRAPTPERTARECRQPLHRDRRPTARRAGRAPCGNARATAREGLARHWPACPRMPDCATPSGTDADQRPRRTDAGAFVARTRHAYAATSARSQLATCRGRLQRQRTLPVPGQTSSVAPRRITCQDLILRGKAHGSTGNARVFGQRRPLIRELRRRSAPWKTCQLSGSRTRPRIAPTASGYRRDRIARHAVGASPPRRRICDDCRRRIARSRAGSDSARRRVGRSRPRRRRRRITVADAVVVAIADAGSTADGRDGSRPSGSRIDAIAVAIAEPGAVELAHGIPHRGRPTQSPRKRLRPQIAEWIGRRVIDHDSPN